MVFPRVFRVRWFVVLKHSIPLYNQVGSHIHVDKVVGPASVLDFYECCCLNFSSCSAPYLVFFAKFYLFIVLSMAPVCCLLFPVVFLLYLFVFLAYVVLFVICFYCHNLHNHESLLDFIFPLVSLLSLLLELCPGPCFWSLPTQG